MTYELNEGDFYTAEHLYKPALQFPLIKAVFEGQQVGRVFRGKHVALVVTKFGFMQLFGRCWYDKEFDREVERLVFGDSTLPNYLLWYAPPDDWQRKMSHSTVVRRGRVRLWLNSPKLVDLPKGYKLRQISESDLFSLTALGVDIGTKFWSSKGDFLENGFGFCASAGEQIVSVCYSACVAGGSAEIDVLTAEEHRCKGLAASVVSAFTNYATSVGIEPTWDCFVENKASYNLARRLGFQPWAWYTFNTIDRKKL